MIRTPLRPRGFGFFLIAFCLGLGTVASGQFMPYFENFDQPTPPSLPDGWSLYLVSGSGTWVTHVGTVLPPGLPSHSGLNLLYFAPDAAATIMAFPDVPVFLLTDWPASEYTLSLFVYHDAIGTPGLWVQPYYCDYYVDSTTFFPWGAPVLRNDGTTGWSRHDWFVSDCADLASGYIGIALVGQSDSNTGLYVDDLMFIDDGPQLFYHSSIVMDSCPTMGPGHADGVIDPGEQVSLFPVLFNYGNEPALNDPYFPISSIATLVSPATGVTITQPMSPYPDIPAGATGTAIIPVELSIDESVPCGTEIVMDLWASFGGSGFTQSGFKLTVGSPSLKTLLYQHFEPIEKAAGSAAGGSPDDPDRLVHRTPIDLTGLTERADFTLSFRMYHESGPVDAELLQPQISADGGESWVDAGAPIPRLAPEGASGWETHTVDLCAYLGAPALRVGLLGIGQAAADFPLESIHLALTDYTCNPCLDCRIDTCDAWGFAGTIPLTADFGAEVTYLGCDGTPTWSWDFGDGGASTEQYPAHAYAAGGTYNWTCTITVDDQTCTRTGSVTVCQIVHCTAAANQTNVPAPMTVDFTGTVNTAGCDGEPVSWFWDFGDGATSTEQNATHTYAAGGTYTISMTVTVGLLTCTQTGPFTVCQLIECAAVPSQAYGPAPLAVDFTGSVNRTGCGGAPGWAWDFGDGGTSTAQNPAHTYTAGGVYSWSMTVTVEAQT